MTSATASIFRSFDQLLQGVWLTVQLPQRIGRWSCDGSSSAIVCAADQDEMDARPARFLVNAYVDQSFANGRRRRGPDLHCVALALDRRSLEVARSRASQVRPREEDCEHSTIGAYATEIVQRRDRIDQPTDGPRSRSGVSLGAEAAAGVPVALIIMPFAQGDLSRPQQPIHHPDAGETGAIVSHRISAEERTFTRRRFSSPERSSASRSTPSSVVQVPRFCLSGSGAVLNAWIRTRSFPPLAIAPMLERGEDLRHVSCVSFTLNEVLFLLEATRWTIAVTLLAFVGGGILRSSRQGMFLKVVNSRLTRCDSRPMAMSSCSRARRSWPSFVRA